MDWKTRLKHALQSRYTLTAVLFLLITAWGAGTVALGLADRRAACAGYAVPWETAQAAKSDPTAPGRTLSAAATRLDGPAPAQSRAKALSARTAETEAAVTAALEEERTLIQLFGLYENLSGRTVVEDPADSQYAVAKLPGGSLTFTGTGEPDAQAQAAELERLRLALDERSCALLYCQAPSKLDPDGQSLPAGVTDTSNADADALLAALEARGMDCLDFRRTLKAAGGDWSRWFYQTDHHWTQEAAFLCFGALCEKLEDYDQTLSVSWGEKTRPISIPERYTDPDAYASTTLSGFFLGSQGKRVGSLYGGVDDFVLHTPTFPTLLHYSAAHDGERYGDAEDTVLFPERVEQRQWFTATPYEYYAGGDYPVAHITNYYNPQGPRILLIRDSYACAVTPYLSLISSRLTTIDPRHFSGNVMDYVDWLRPDVVIVLYSSGMVRGEDFYRLLSQPTPSKTDVFLSKKPEW